MAKASTRDYDVVVAVGGDGTANEVVNGIIGSSARMAVIPAGSGNDFARMLGMEDDISGSLDQIISGKAQTIDTGATRLEDSSGTKTTRTFINSIGIGFDAIVAYESQRIKRLKGVSLDLLSVLRSLKRLKPDLFEVSFNGKQESEHYYLVCVGNGNREGGGFFVTPTANPSDGMLEVCTVKHVPVVRALQILPTILKGKHGRFPEVDFFSTDRISVGSGKRFVVHCDGEILGIENSKVEIEMIPRSLNVVVGDGGLQLAI